MTKKFQLGVEGLLIAILGNTIILTGSPILGSILYILGLLRWGFSLIFMKDKE